MSLILNKVIWTPASGENEELKDVESINLSRQTETKASTANITLKNNMVKIVTGFSQPLSKYVSDSNKLRFNEGDSIKIYMASVDVVRDLDTTITSTDLIMSGEVAEVKGKAGEKSSKLTIKIVDKTWVILNRLHVFNYKASLNLNAPKIIQRVIRTVTTDVSQDDLSYDDDGNHVSNGKYSVDARLDTDGGYIETARQNTTEFPDTSIAKVYKPAYEFIKELSTLEFTNDFPTEDENNPPQNRTMIFYIDERNKFHWFYPNDTGGSGLTFIEGDDSTGNKIISMNMTYSTFDIINLVFFNSGNDLYGSGISSYLYDKNTKSKEFKQVYKPYTEIAKEWVKAEIDAGNLILDNAQTVFTWEGNNYKADAYGFTTSWGVDTAGFSDSDYNDALRSKCISDGKGRAANIFKNRGSPRWKGKIECKFKIYTPSDLIQLTSTRLGINQRKLRIKSSQYNITKSGGFVSLSVEEDERKTGAN